MACVLVVALRLYCLLFQQSIKIWFDSLAIVQLLDSVIK